MGADVYHKKSFEELLKHSRDTEGAVARLQAIENATWPQDYDFVATVDTDNLEVAFELTNSIDCAWWTNAKVISRFEDNGCRSTSVGDIVVLADGRVLRCENSGWSALPNIEAPNGFDQQVTDYLLGLPKKELRTIASEYLGARMIPYSDARVWVDNLGREALSDIRKDFSFAFGPE